MVYKVIEIEIWGLLVIIFFVMWKNKFFLEGNLYREESIFFGMEKDLENNIKNFGFSCVLN